MSQWLKCPTAASSPNEKNTSSLRAVSFTSIPHLQEMQSHVRTCMCCEPCCFVVSCLRLRPIVNINISSSLVLLADHCCNIQQYQFPILYISPHIPHQTTDCRLAAHSVTLRSHSAWHHHRQADLASANTHTTIHQALTNAKTHTALPNSPKSTPPS